MIYTVTDGSKSYTFDSRISDSAHIYKALIKLFPGDNLDIRLVVNALTQSMSAGETVAHSDGPNYLGLTVAEYPSRDIFESFFYGE